MIWKGQYDMLSNKTRSNNKTLQRARLLDILTGLVWPRKSKKLITPPGSSPPSFSSSELHPGWSKFCIYRQSLDEIFINLRFQIRRKLSDFRSPSLWIYQSYLLRWGGACQGGPVLQTGVLVIYTSLLTRKIIYTSLLIRKIMMIMIMTEYAMITILMIFIIIIMWICCRDKIKCFVSQNEKKDIWVNPRRKAGLFELCKQFRMPKNYQNRCWNRAGIPKWFGKKWGLSGKNSFVVVNFCCKTCTFLTIIYGS